jgi:hypothetical protein
MQHRPRIVELVLADGPGMLEIGACRFQMPGLQCMITQRAGIGRIDPQAIEELVMHVQTQGGGHLGQDDLLEGWVHQTPGLVAFGCEEPLPHAGHDGLDGGGLDETRLQDELQGQAASGHGHPLD